MSFMSIHVWCVLCKAARFVYSSNEKEISYFYLVANFFDPLRLQRGLWCVTYLQVRTADVLTL